MGQNTSLPSRGRRRSLRTFRSPFPRRSNSHQNSLSATFTIPENDQKIEQVNVNVASEEELMTLPGITRPIAQSIVEHRRVIGRFKKVEDLALVSGIGAEKLDKIRPEICVTKRSCASSRAQSMDSLKSTDSSRVGFKISNTHKIVDVNKATVFDLQCVHGLTQELAANIIHYRDKKGCFKSIDGLLKVKGIDAIRLGSMRSQLTVNAPDEDGVSTASRNKNPATGTPASESNGLPNGAIQIQHTPKHRKSLSAPMKFSLSLGNGLSKAPINDIFDLLSAYSYRPIVEEDFKYERNGEKAVRIATWNLDRLCLQKAENLGFREVVCRTILENRFSIIAVQDVLDVSALKLICDELNKPSLRRVSEWKENSHEWRYCLSDVQCMLSKSIPAVGFIYDGACGGLHVEFASLTELPQESVDAPKSKAALATFHIGDISLSLVNVCIRADTSYEHISSHLKRFFLNKDETVLILGDFTDFGKYIEEWISTSELLNIVPISTNTSSMSINLHLSSTGLRYADNMLLGDRAKLQYTGVSGVVRQGLTHMAIPRGWSWGGPASEHCPVWCEVYVRHVTRDPTLVNKLDSPIYNGHCLRKPVNNTDLPLSPIEVKLGAKAELKNGGAISVPNASYIAKDEVEHRTMAWMLVNPQIHNIFASLGVQQGDVYKVNDDCLAILGEILSKLTVEDRTLRTFRRAIGFGQHIRKDLLPLLIHIKDDAKITDASKIIDAIIKILVNLTIPVECLFSMDALSKTDVGRHTIFEINKLLITSKEAFVESRSIRAVMDHMRYVIERGTKLEIEQCDSINNCLLLLRNILHIPEHRVMQISSSPLPHSSVQNKILWNLFTHSIDKLLLHLMSFPEKMYWVVTMVQLIALMYKDQHVGTLQKLLNLWFEASLSESSDDNESNTSPPNQGSGDSSPLHTSDPTSDSSDNGGSKKSNRVNTQCNNSNEVKQHVNRSTQNRNKVLLTSQKHAPQRPSDVESSISSQTTDSKKEDYNIISRLATAYDITRQSPSAFRAQKRKLGQGVNRIEYSHPSGAVSSESTSQSESIVNMKKQESLNLQSELSDYGYGTQVENQESISTSSNDDETPQQKPVHQKPHVVQKSRYNKNRNTTPQEKKELRRKKLIKRSKTHTINMKGMMHHSPTDEDISNILKEFTVDFLLKGYGTLVQELYRQLMTNSHIQIDTSHFFWLVTYFLKFATQLELDFKHISPVLSFNIISYLYYEGVNLYEQLEINCLQSETDLKPCLRRMHLVVTAIREFFQAIETYKKITHLTAEDKQSLLNLQIQIASTENLKCLFLLLIRQYNPNIQSRQYLQDLITTNHVLLLFLDNTMKYPEFKGTNNMVDHLKQFATVDVMHHYGLLLEDFDNNGKFINDCVFTMMHHIGGDIDHIATLFQPNILKAFSNIWESDYEICDDWSDLIEYVIHKFINVPRQPTTNNNNHNKNNNNSRSLQQPLNNVMQTNLTFEESLEKEVWSEEDIDSLYWYYIQSRKCEDIIGNILRLYSENGIKNKTRKGIIQELLDQNMINKNCFDEYMRNENINKCDESVNNTDKERDQKEFYDIQVIKEQLVKDNKGKAILWLQKLLIQACHCKIVISNEAIFKEDFIVEFVPYCFAKLNQSIPIVPWSKEQNSVINNQLFMLLLHKLGFHLPADTRKLFVRIPNFWTADHLYSIAQKLGPIDRTCLKFDIKLLKSADLVECISSLDVRLPEDAEEQTLTSVIQYPAFGSAEAEVPEMKSPPSAAVPNVTVIDLEAEDAQVLSSDDMRCPDAPADSILTTDEFERNSICETSSVTSDLTRMYVSDEEDEQ